MKRYAWILIIVGVLAIVGTAFQLAPHRVTERTCPSGIVMTKGKDGAPQECVCSRGVLTSCFGPGP
jgi:hypothetical protein